MTLDFTISVPVMITIAAAFGGGITAWVTMRGRVAVIDSTVFKLGQQLASAETQIKDARERIEQVRANGAQELADFKLQVAKDYATNTAVAQMEERVVSAIDRLGDRLDKLIDASARKPGRTA